MASYVTTTDALVALNGTIPFNSVSIPCNKGNVVPLVPGILNLNGNTSNRFARYEVTLQGNIQIPTGGAVTPIALGITVNGVVVPDSVAIVTRSRRRLLAYKYKNFCNGSLRMLFNCFWCICRWDRR